MGNEFKGLASHSAEYFGDSRDYWWYEDFLRATVSRWGPVRSMLDVGCGVGHWGRLLARLLPGDVRLTGVDRDPAWVAKATEKAAAVGLGDRATYRQGTADALPFGDCTFDLVTCQTVLIHMADPARVVREMMRVTRPGGLVVAAEPNNFVNSVLLEALAVGATPDEMAPLLRFQMLCHNGKATLGEGNDRIGESVPALFQAAGLEDIQVRLNDRPYVMLPPYGSPAERALAEEMQDQADRGIWVWNRDQTRRYFLAGGGTEADFDAGWDLARAFQRRAVDAVRAGQFRCAGGSLFYLVWGRKPTE